ncbi:MAG TPA: class I SAM-dependent rRNA methyltransferase [Bacteroidia bacterium]|nr:class I SAM-dependent rRNA methyltransferase [Bacteroidia bacterium]
MSYPILQLHKGKEISLLRKHPWVFSGAIKSATTALEEGELVEVHSASGVCLGTGYFAKGSIAVRMLSFEASTIDVNFWFSKLRKAYEYRMQLGILNDQTNVCRLFFGEGDGAPGLIIDFYDGHLVIQAHSWGIFLQTEQISQALQKLFGESLKSIYNKSAESLARQKSKEQDNAFLYGNCAELVVKENGHLFYVDFIKGQKTGFFVDQRDNRQLLASYAKDRKVLNTFCYTGGFSVYAAKSGAIHVDSVDSSAGAIDLCKRNMALNGIVEETSLAQDAFEFLKDKKQVYDLIVLDPPAFAKSRESKHKAVIAYKNLNSTAMKYIKPGGIIFTFSCSGVVDKHLFYNTITAAAIEAGRNIRVLHYLNQPADHPVSPFFPEGEYLKGMVLWVE